MPTIKSMFAMLSGTPRRRNTAASSRCQFEQLESRIVLTAIACEAALPQVDADVIAVTNQAVDARLERVGDSAVDVNSFPDVCFTPPAPPMVSGMDANDSEPVQISENQSTSRFANAGSAQAVVVIKHADGTIEWIYDLPSVKTGQSGDEGGGVWNSGHGTLISGNTLDGIRTRMAQGGGILNCGGDSLSLPEANGIIAILIALHRNQADSEEHAVNRESDSAAKQLDLLFLPGTADSVQEGLLSELSGCSIASPEIGETERTYFANGETTDHGRIANSSPASFVTESDRARKSLYLNIVGDWDGDGLDTLGFRR